MPGLRAVPLPAGLLPGRSGQRLDWDGSLWRSRGAQGFLVLCFQGFQQLKATHAALEEEYLRACREPHLAAHLASSRGTTRKFDPARYKLGRPRNRGAGPGTPWVPRRESPRPHNSHRGAERNPAPVRDTPGGRAWSLETLRLHRQGSRGRPGAGLRPLTGPWETEARGDSLGTVEGPGLKPPGPRGVFSRPVYFELSMSPNW